MVGDVHVGQVEEIVRDGWHARVTMRVNKNVVLPDDAVAELRQTSLLGEKFIALAAPQDDSGAPGGAGRLGEGDVIPLSQTGRNPEVEEVLGALSFLLTGGGPINATTSLVVLAYRTVFQNFQVGQGVSIAFIMTITLVIISLSTTMWTFTWRPGSRAGSPAAGAGILRV